MDFAFFSSFHLSIYSFTFVCFIFLFTFSFFFIFFALYFFFLSLFLYLSFFNLREYSQWMSVFGEILIEVRAGRGCHANLLDRVV